MDQRERTQLYDVFKCDRQWNEKLLSYDFKPVKIVLCHFSFGLLDFYFPADN